MAIRIVNEDCLNGLKSLDANSVDMVLTDPPYFLDCLDNTWSRNTLEKRKSTGVVTSLPKGMKFDPAQSKRFREFYTTVSKEVYRVLKPGGFFLSFSSPRLYHALATAVEDAGFEIRDMLSWVYTLSQMKAFSQNHIIDKSKDIPECDKEQVKAQLEGWKTPQLKSCYEPICLANKPLDGTFVKNMLNHGVGLMNTAAKVGDNMQPANVLTTDAFEPQYDKTFLVPKPSKKEKGDYNDHISVKPVHLLSHLIRLFTPEGSLVLDPFLGSGSTAVACVDTGRSCIGYEIDAHYVDIGQRRVAERNAAKSASSPGE